MIFFFLVLRWTAPRSAVFRRAEGLFPGSTKIASRASLKKKFFVAMVDGTRPSGGANLRVFPGEPHPRWVRL